MPVNVPLPKKHRSLGFYPGQDIRAEVEALIVVLKGKGTSLSAVMRPTLLELIRQHRKDIDQHLKENSS